MLSTPKPYSSPIPHRITGITEINELCNHFLYETSLGSGRFTLLLLAQSIQLHLSRHTKTERERERERETEGERERERWDKTA